MIFGRQKAVFHHLKRWVEEVVENWWNPRPKSTSTTPPPFRVGVVVVVGGSATSRWKI
jgi:hypothetical protein